VSKDSVARHASQGQVRTALPVVSDEDGKIAEVRTWIEKSLYGRKYMGIERATFLIDKEGVVRKSGQGESRGPRRRGEKELKP